MRRALSAAATIAALLAVTAPAAAQDLWSNPATWGGAVPGPGAHVVVPQGRRIVLDVTPPPLGSLTVHGVLTFADQPLDLTVGWIMVHGLFEVGTVTAPYPHRSVITLTGDLDENVMGMGARFLGAMYGGRIDIHGSRRADVDWAVLARSLQPGDTTMSLALVEPNKTALGWRPGDLLAIAPSGRDPFQVEPVTVTAVSGLDVTFTPPLRFPHFGELQTIAGRLVDERAEVGLLTRNIVIQGAADGYARQLGGHVMIMAGSIGRIEGAELRFMGQMGRLGRYPFHWHLTGHAPIDYLRFSSLWNSFHRGVAIHRTSGVEVRGNVAANVWSHTFVVGEDGNETGNVVEDNLGLLTRRLPEAMFVMKRAGEPGADGPAAQDEWRPATFWVNNARNVVRRNRAAGGADAIGFFYDDDHGLAASGDLQATTFADNVAHSYLTSSAGADADASAASGIGLFVRTAERAGELASFGPFTAYQNARAGAWLEPATGILHDAVLAGNPSGVVLAAGALESSLVVGVTANRTSVHPPETWRGGVYTSPSSLRNAPRVQGVTFVAQPIAAVDIDGGYIGAGNRFAGISRIDTPVPVYLRDRRAGGWSGALNDTDGSLTISAGPTLVSGRPIDASSTFVAGWGSFGSGGAFSTARSPVGGPSLLTAAVIGSTVALSWAPPADSSAMLGYRLEAGTAPGRVDALTLDLGTHPGQVFGGVPAGRYFVRVRARFAASLSAPSNDVEVAIGASACLVPDTVARVTSGVASGVVTLSWPPAAGALRHRLLIGESAAAPSLALDVAGTALATAAPPGRYVVRVAGVNACGIGRASSPVTVIVP